jgi:FkbM family methyltransferase
MALYLLGFALAACTGESFQVTVSAATLAHHTLDEKVTITNVAAVRGSIPLVRRAAVPVATPHCPLPANAKWCDVKLGNPFSMAVYNNDDIVSKSICDVGTWELQHEDITAMGEPGHALDIGANIGFYSLVLAAAGWHVTAFEPMVANSALIEATLCKNPSLKPKITLNKVGLGGKDDHCIIISGDDNLGDGVMRCGADAIKFKHDGEKGYHQRATVEIRRLDDILEQQKVKSIQFVKMDVEGF